MTDPVTSPLLESCRVAYPELDVDPAAFVAYVLARCPEGRAETWLAEVQGPDLYLAFACLEARPQALVVFDRTYGGTIVHSLRSLHAGARDDASQVIKQRLFAGTSPKIASYSGKGPLRGWLRVVTRRVLLELVEKQQPLADDWEVAALPVSGDNPEVAYLKAKYSAEYKLAFSDALSGLPPRDRTVLAQYHVDGLTIDELGALYQVHRVTASRWVLRIQVQLRDRILELLRDRLGLSSADLRSVTRMVRSQLSLSLARPLPNP